MSESKNRTKSFVEGVFSAEENSAASIKSEHLGKYSALAVKMFHTGVLTPKEMMWPAIGQFAAKMLIGLNTYQNLYFINVLKIDMTYVTLILTLIGIYDVLNNPLMGIAYDRTRTRWGKARPYIFGAAIPYFLSNAVLYSGAMFFGDRAGNDPRKIIFLFVMLFIRETVSTIYTIPRDNLVTLQTANPGDRIAVGLLQQYVGEAGSQLIYFIFPPLMELNNKGYVNIPMPVVFFILSVITCSVGALGNIGMAVGCRERIALQPKPAPIMKSLFYILKNKYALRNFIAEFALGLWSNGGYSWDVVTQQEIFGGSIPTMIAYLPYNTLDYLSIGLIPKFRKLFKNNNRRAVIALRCWDFVSCICMVLIGDRFIDKKWIMVGLYGLFGGLNALNNGPSNVFEAELKREVNDYTEYVTGERPDGTIGLITGLLTKITAPINALLTIKLFKWSGYDSTLPMLPWSQGNRNVYKRVFFLFYGMTAFPNIISMIPYLFYDLEGEKREKMYIALNERRALLAKEQAVSDDLKEIIESFEEDEK